VNLLERQPRILMWERKLRTGEQLRKMPAMNKLIRLFALPCVLLLAAATVAGVPSQQAKPPAEPAKIMISVSPSEIPAGGLAKVTLQLAPKPGIVINRYPKMKLAVPEQDGLSGGAEVAIGNDGPPPVGQEESNYFETVDPLELQLELAKNIKSGSHQFQAHLVYFYCVKKSGFCAPARVNVIIPVQVR
jgi:hypothetical protein